MQPAANLLPVFADMELNHQLTLIALAAFSAIWITALGAAIGSFLNVVVYRLPLGMSLVRPKSRCPACGASIRASDNVPVLGWLRLKGRCRNCRNPISVRYPLVEATTAALFLGLAHFELFSGGTNLPGASVVTPNLNSILWNVRPDLITLYLYHVVLGCSLLCLSLIVWDGYAPPKSLVATTLLLGLSVPLFLPSVHPISSGIAHILQRDLIIENGRIVIGLYSSGLVNSVTGLGVGLLLGGVVAISVKTNADCRGVFAAMTMIGAFLGWQAVVSCAFIAAVLSVARPLLACFLPLPLTFFVATSVLIQIPLWKTLDRLTWWPGSHGWRVLRSTGWPEPGFAISTLSLASVAAVLIFIATSWLTDRMQKSSPRRDVMIDSVTANPATTQNLQGDGITAGDAD